ncbi:hypothetical protein PAPYR_2172 [Paratrimastix pyriformis]|uniref:Uncharacterized protein n=1 Tax=Paratrimastix pyriformis TaxID=342808 RepID=A0ABQ8UQZ7_9EUKA|nr:hypothetical protein PAPYR_2172 [Paratrimastix pyriformis]
MPVTIRQFSHDTPHGPIFFQVWVLEKSFFIWCGHDDGRMGSVSTSLKTPFDSLPSSALLLPDNQSAAQQDADLQDPSTRMASRLTQAAGCPIMCATSLPADQIDFAIAAARRYFTKEGWIPAKPEPTPAPAVPSS